MPCKNSQTQQQSFQLGETPQSKKRKNTEMFDYHPNGYPLWVLPPDVYMLGEYPAGNSITFRLRRSLPFHYGFLRYLIRERFLPQLPWTPRLQRFFVAFFIIEPHIRNVKTLTEEELNLLYKPISRLLRRYRRQYYDANYEISKGEYLFSNN